MTIKLEDIKAGESIVTHLPLPVSQEMFERYRKIQNDLHNKKMKTLHSLTRERLSELLNEIEQALLSA